MTYGELTRISALLKQLRDTKKQEIESLRRQGLEDPAIDPKLNRAVGEYCGLSNLVEVVSHDLTNLQGVGPGDLFTRVSPKSAQLRATESVAEELSKINDTLSRIVTYG